MGDLKGRLRRLEEELKGAILTIRQRDGTLRRFSPGAGEAALLNFIERIGAGEDAPDLACWRARRKWSVVRMVREPRGR